MSVENCNQLRTRKVMRVSRQRAVLERQMEIIQHTE